MTRPADGSPLRGQTERVEQAARVCTAHTDDDGIVRLPSRIAYLLIFLLALGCWVIVASAAFGLVVSLWGWP